MVGIDSKLTNYRNIFFSFYSNTVLCAKMSRVIWAFARSLKGGVDGTKRVQFVKGTFEKACFTEIFLKF